MILKSGALSVVLEDASVKVTLHPQRSSVSQPPKRISRGGLMQEGTISVNDSFSAEAKLASRARLLRSLFPFGPSREGRR